MRLDFPPALPGNAELYSYLFRVVELLNLSMEQVEQISGTDVRASAALAQQEQAKAASDLKALIVNTAAIVRREMDEMQTQLHGETEAVSQAFGVFRENIDATITATANGLLQEYGYDARLDALDTAAAGFESYRVSALGYIRQGFIEYDSRGVPILGIAIGQNLKSTTVVVEGQAMEQLDTSQSCAFYTADKVSFRIGGNEVAYFSNRKLYIIDAQVTGNLTVGDWLMTHDSAGLTLQWIGG